VRNDIEHHTSLEATLREIMEMMARQEVVSQLVAREKTSKQDLVQSLVARQHAVELETKLNRLHPADAAFMLESLPAEQRDAAWQLIRQEGRGTILLELAASVRSPLVALLEDDELLALGRQMPPTDFADLVENLPKVRKRRILARLDSGERQEVQTALSFPPDSVGALMETDVVTVRADLSQVAATLAVPASAGFLSTRRLRLTAAAVAVAGVAGFVAMWPGPVPRAAGRGEYAQITHFADSVTSPALSRDGRLLTVPLEPGDDVSSVPAANGIRTLPLSAISDPDRYPNVALIAFAAPGSDALAEAAADVARQRGLIDLPALIVAWLGWIWGVDDANPLVAGQGIPGAAFVEAVHAIADIELTPGLASASSCPEAIWQSAKWWGDYYRESARVSAAGMTRSAGHAQPQVPAGVYSVRQHAAAVTILPTAGPAGAGSTRRTGR